MDAKWEQEKLKELTAKWLELSSTRWTASALAEMELRLLKVELWIRDEETHRVEQSELL